MPVPLSDGATTSSDVPPDGYLPDSARSNGGGRILPPHTTYNRQASGGLPAPSSATNATDRQPSGSSVGSGGGSTSQTGAHWRPDIQEFVQLHDPGELEELLKYVHKMAKDYDE
jgi:hypothetical protein